MNFLKYKLLYFSLSGLFVGLGLLALVFWGLKPAIDFTGGSLIEYRFETLPELDLLRSAFPQQDDYDLAGLQTAEEQRLIVKTTTITQEQSVVILNVLKEKFGQSIEVERFETIGPTFGNEVLKKMVIAVVLTAGFILIYVAWIFKNVQYGVSAILAMLHDTIILLGSFAVFGYFYGVEIDTLFVTAVLTTLTFSVHDTVVVYDRIRESFKQNPRTELHDLANKAITETMGRSINNSLTIIFMLTALLLLGGTVIKWFAAALLIGTIVGTYSSPFIAVPLLVLWHNLKKK